ncbi:MAG: hypothetical protein J6R42_04075, partial [Clostridia bacterium]|nr:hypothetical protein [Clostridia bacterium]
YLPYDKNTEKRLCHFDRHGIFAVVEVPKKGTNRQSVGALRHAVRQLRAHPSLLMWSIGDVAVSLDAIRAERIALRLRHEVALLDFAHPVMGEVNALTSPTIVKALDLLLTQGGKVNAELVKSNHSQRPIWVASQAEDEFLAAFHLGEKSRYAGHLQIVEQTISPCESAIFRLMMAHPRLWIKLKACYCQKDPVLALQLPEQDATDAHTSLLLLSNCENVCMWVDGRPYGDMSKLNSPDKVLSIPSEFGYVEAVGFRRGKEVARFEYEPVGRAYALSLSPFFMPPSLKEGDVMWVVCQVLDGEGKSVEQAEGEVSFTLTGGAVFDAEPTLCEGEPFVLKLSGGRAALSLRKTERSASITLHAQSTAYVPTSLRLK